jgi:hypothetical protein
MNQRLARTIDLSTASLSEYSLIAYLNSDVRVSSHWRENLWWEGFSSAWSIEDCEKIIQDMSSLFLSEIWCEIVHREQGSFVSQSSFDFSLRWHSFYERCCICMQNAHSLTKMSVHLSTISVRSQSTNSEHALNTIVVSWKWYDFLKRVRTEDLLIRVLFRVQWVVPWSRAQHMISILAWFINAWFINKHWHLF